MIKSFKKTVFFGLALACPLLNTPTIAMEIETDFNHSRKMNIGDITPVKDGMTEEDAKSAIQSFFRNEVFVEQNEITWEDICRVENTSSPAGRSYTLITLNDRSEWVPNVPVQRNGDQYVVVRHGLDDPDGIQRFLGALYLKKAISYHSLETELRAVDTKFLLINPMNPINIKVKKSTDEPLENIFTIDSQDFISLSRYAGETKPNLGSKKRFELIKLTSYCDLVGNVNLRKEAASNIITIIDTAYNSFLNDKFYSYEKYMDQSLLSDDEYFADNFIVEAPSPDTEKAIGGKTFTFSKEDLMGSTH